MVMTQIANGVDPLPFSPSILRPKRKQNPMCIPKVEKGFRGRPVIACTVLLAIALPVFLPVAAIGQEVSQEEDMQRQRKEAAHRQRRLIFNNDGNEVFLFPSPSRNYGAKPPSDEVTPANFLAMRSTPLIDSHVDAIFYCTISAGFGLFSHDTKVGQVLDQEQYGETRRVFTEDLIAQGKDILQIMVEFGREHDKELFWSMRMNDIHDQNHRVEKPHPLFPKLKTEHPEYLMGHRNGGGSPPYGSWSGVDYAHPEVRELAFRFIEEVCEGYDIDGVELDFFRSPVLFKSHAWGNVVTQEERDALTDLMRRVHAMTQEVSLRRGRPLLISIRVPDSVAYCSAMGIDLERWLQEGLTDLLVVGGDFRLTPWEESVALGHRYNVPVYPCLTFEGRKQKWFEWVGTRSTVEAYRARALEAWNAGADGIYLFNLFDPKARQWQELGDPEMLLTLDRVYHGSTVTIKFANEKMPDGLRFRRLPLLSPEYPETLEPGKPLATTINIGEDVRRRQDQGIVPRLSLELQVEGLDSASGITATMNGNRLEKGRLRDSWLEYPLKPAWVQEGSNRIGLALTEEREAGPVVQDVRLRITVK